MCLNTFELKRKKIKWVYFKWDDFGKTYRFKIQLKFKNLKIGLKSYIAFQGEA